MEVYSADITALTSSFRYPMLISGTQLTLEVPPINTILGLINCAAGRYLKYTGSMIGYYFEYGGKAIDIETVYMAEVGKYGNLLRTSRPNAIKREVLFDVFLRIYSTDEQLIEYLRCPFYQIVLGRSSDLATVDINSIGKRHLRTIEHADKIRGQIIPFSKAQLPGQIQALSQYFTDTFPRELLGKEPYSVVGYLNEVKTSLLAYRDEVRGREVDIFFHEIDTARFH